MVRTSAVIAGLMVAALVSQGMADERGGDKGPKVSLIQALLQHFDRDGDGALDEQEKALAREAIGKHLTPGGPTDRPDAKKRANRFGSDGERIPAAALKRFDKDGDGKLNDTERAAAKEALTKAGGPGGAINREALVKRFDKDGDGMLNEEEQAQAKAEFEKLRGGLNRNPEDGNPAKDNPGEGAPRKSRLDNGAVLKQFDKDGDGQLNDEEKAAAREALRNRIKDQ